MDVSLVAWIVGGIAALGAGVWLLLSWVVYHNVSMLSNPEKCLHEGERWSNLDFGRVIDQHISWAQEHGFESYSSYMLRAPGAVVYMAMWRHAAQPIFLCVYFTQQPTRKVVYDLVTVLDEQRHLGLTSTSSPDGLLFPATPGTFRQGFAEVSLDVLWQWHTEAEVFLFQQLNLEPRPLQADPFRILCDSIRRQMRHIRSHSLWPLRGPWWYFTRKRRQNRSVEEQFARGEAGPEMAHALAG